MLRIELEPRRAFEPGEEIAVQLGWDFSTAPESVELRVVWNTSGKGTQDVGVASVTPFEFPKAHETRRTTVSLPEQPYSFSGKLISIVWALELVALPDEQSTREEVTIGPGAKEVLALGQDNAGA